VLGIGSQNGCDFACYTWFFGNTDLHFLFLILRAQIRNLEIGIERKSLGVMNGLASRSFFRSRTIDVSRTNLPAVHCIFCVEHRHKRMPFPSGLKISFCFHNNERGKYLRLLRIFSFTDIFFG
jgi:hypothetical protein